MEEFLKKLREKLGLAEDATEEQIIDKLAEVKAAAPTDPPKEESKDVVKFSELAEAFGDTRLSTKEDLLEKARKMATPEGLRERQLSKQFPEEYKLLTEQRELLFKQETEIRLSEWHRGGDFGGIAPALDEMIADIRKALPPSGRKKFDEFVGALLEVGLVPSGELGSASVVLDDEAGEFYTAMALIQKEHSDWPKEKVIRETALKHPQLAEAYRKATQRIAVEGG